MNAERFSELISNSEYKEHLAYLYGKFEHFVEEKVVLNDEFMDQVTDLLDDEELRLHLMELRRKIPKLEKHDLLKSRIHSLQTNITGFISLSRDAQNNNSKRPRKFKRILTSYIAVSRLAIGYDRIYKVLNDSMHLGKKIVLAVGMIKLSEDDILVNKEIEGLYIDSFSQNSYCVVPLFECDTGFFRNAVMWIRPEIVHLAGHGTKMNNKRMPVLRFVDEDLTSKKFAEIAFNVSDLVFINCCHSFQFSFPKDPAINALFVVHDGAVAPSVALNFSTNFYAVLWNSNSIGDMTQWVFANGFGTGYKCL